MTVVVVGSVNIDFVITGGSIPRPGETVTAEQYIQGHGGKGANQAAAAAALGARTVMVGAVGDDEWGASALQELGSRGVDVSAMLTTTGPTGVAFVTLDGSGENCISIVPGANSVLSALHVREAMATVSAPDKVAVVACLEVSTESVLAAAEFARDRGWTFILNPAPARPLPKALLQLVDVLTPNQGELETLGDVTDLLNAGVGAIVVTRGGDGCTLSLPGHPVETLPAAPATVVDSTGAGDAFTAALAVALTEGRTLRAATVVAVTAGAIATEGLGARGSLPSAAAVVQRLSSSRS